MGQFCKMLKEDTKGMISFKQEEIKTLSIGELEKKL